MNKEEMIKAIYEEIADKTLSFGCIIKSHHNRKPKTWSSEQFTNDIFIAESNKNYYYHSSPIDWEWIWKPRYKSDNIEIIWHPVMIWDILLRVKKKWWNMVISSSWNIMFNKSWTPEANWSYKEIWWYKVDKSVNEQSISCIEYIYNLIQK